jgi:hypothetical protein
MEEWRRRIALKGRVLALRIPRAVDESRVQARGLLRGG